MEDGKDYRVGWYEEAPQEAQAEAPPNTGGRLLEKTFVCMLAIFFAWGALGMDWAPLSRARHYLSVALTVDYAGRIGEAGRTLVSGGKSGVEGIISRLRAWDGPGQLQWPVDGTVVGAYGWRQDRVGRTFSGGIDLAAGPGETVSAAAPGRVVRVLPLPGNKYGITVENGGWQVYYGLLEVVMVGVGDTVRAGQELGRLATTGPPLLRMELRIRNSQVDPLKYLPERT